MEGVMSHRTYTIVACLLLFATCATAQVRRRLSKRGGETTQTQSVKLTFQGMNRRYLLHVPDRSSGALVLAFHGGSETPDNLETVSCLTKLSDREHFIVAYPEGIDKSWADGRKSTAADKKGIDDVGFAKAIVADIAKTHDVDMARIYATGPSNGGIFSNRLGCDAADTVVAIAPVIGAMPSNLAQHCKPRLSVSVIGIQGVADPVVPFQGGEVGGSLEGKAAGGKLESSRATQELWRTLEGCSADVSSAVLPVRVKDGTKVTKRIYSGCREGSDVVWYEIDGGGHRWPPHQSNGLMEKRASGTLGVSSQNIDASEVIWKFFEAHSRAATFRSRVEAAAR
jgi:polyhydroxybutyrate depolymerase